VFIYCETAHRSPMAARKLRRIGFVEITDLKKGYKPYRKSLKK
jgi:rhodanese-related sulfurtransferase